MKGLQELNFGVQLQEMVSKDAGGLEQDVMEGVTDLKGNVAEITLYALLAHKFFWMRLCGWH